MKNNPIVAGLCSLALVYHAWSGMEQTVNDLVPRLAAEKVEERYGAQMELQAVAANASRPGAEAERGELVKLLASKAADARVPQPARVWLVRQLEYIGATESVPVLTELLKNEDPELRECARRALEKSTSPAATTSLRLALQSGREPAWTIGLIQSLGERHDTAAVTLITESLGSPAASSAALAALAKIANDAALQELWSALAKPLPGASEALLAAAEQLIARGEKKSAAQICARLYADKPEWRVMSAALVGLAKTDPEQAKPLVRQGLSCPEWRVQSAAVQAARDIYGKKVSDALAALFPDLNTGARALVIPALDAGAETQLIGAVAEPQDEVRLAALERLGEVGTAASVPVLTRAARENSSAAKAARVALARVSGPGVEDAIAKLATQGEPESRALAIGVLGDRGERSAVPALLKYAAESDAQVSRAACSALGRLGGEAELEPLIGLTLSAKSPGAEAALQAVAGRAQDKSAAARKVIALLPTADAQRLAAMFDVLAILGGKDALAAVTSRMSTLNEEIKDAAIRALAAWPEFDAIQPLLGLAAAPETKSVYNVLALQGIARLIKSCDQEPAAARAEAAVAALGTAKRPEEKKSLIAALGSVPDPKAGDALKPFLSEPEFRAEAAMAAMNLAQRLNRGSRAAARALAQAVKEANVSADLNRRAERILGGASRN